MTWPLLVQLMQVFAGILWATVAIYRVGSVPRLWRGKADMQDVRGVLMFSIAATQFGFVLRWFLYSHSMPDMGAVELQFWAALYLLSGIEAFAAIIIFLMTREG